MMNATPTAPPTPVGFEQTLAPRPCSRPTCKRSVREPWDETGTLCADCALEAELFDRETRRERVFPA